MFVCSVDLLIMQTLFSTREALKRIFETHRKQLEQKSSYMTVGNQTFDFSLTAARSASCRLLRRTIAI